MVYKSVLCAVLLSVCWKWKNTLFCLKTTSFDPMLNFVTLLLYFLYHVVSCIMWWVSCKVVVLEICGFCNEGQQSRARRQWYLYSFTIFQFHINICFYVQLLKRKKYEENHFSLLKVWMDLRYIASAGGMKWKNKHSNTFPIYS